MTKVENQLKVLTGRLVLVEWNYSQAIRIGKLMCTLQCDDSPAYYVCENGEFHHFHIENVVAIQDNMIRVS